MKRVVEKALQLWGAEGAEYTLIAARENAVYRVTDQHHTFALRLHRQGYRSNQELRSELEWMAAASQGGLIVPTPIAAASGDLLQIIDGVQVDALTWLSGAPLAETIETFSSQKRVEIFGELGREMARLHDISDAWKQPEGFTRCAWNIDGMLGGAPLWGRFWDNPELCSTDRQLLMDVRKQARVELSEIQETLDYGLIHADLVSANVMLDGDDLKLIDFDDGGFGFRVFEVATALLKFIDDHDFDDLKIALVAGYRTLRPLDTSTLDLFMLLRATTYVGWNITRMNEEGAGGRNERFINTARKLALSYRDVRP